MHVKGTAAKQWALPNRRLTVDPWTPRRTQQTSYGGSSWMDKSARMSCSSTFPPISCWRGETACSHLRWTWAAWSGSARLTWTRRWSPLWATEATTAETIRTERFRATGGPPAAPTEPGYQTELTQRERQVFSPEVSPAEESRWTPRQTGSKAVCEVYIPAVKQADNKSVQLDS